MCGTGRMRGPILALAFWLRHALRAYPSAAFVCKADAVQPPPDRALPAA